MSPENAGSLPLHDGLVLTEGTFAPAMRGRGGHSLVVPIPAWAAHARGGQHPDGLQFVTSASSRGEFLGVEDAESVIGIHG